MRAEYPADLRYLRTRMDWSAKLDQTYDEDAKTRLSGILNEMDRYYEKRDAIALRVIMTKSFEFDGTLMNVCADRADELEGFGRGVRLRLNLGWFTCRRSRGDV